MGHAVEKEELGDVEGLDEHGEARCCDCGQGDDVQDTDDVEDDVAWASQGLLEERHCFVDVDVDRWLVDTVLVII